MRPEGWFKRLLRKLGIIKEPKFDEQKSNELKREMYNVAETERICL